MVNTFDFFGILLIILLIAAKDAPVEIPINNPSSLEALRVKLKASSLLIVMISSINSRLNIFGTKPVPIPLQGMRRGTSAA